MNDGSVTDSLVSHVPRRDRERQQRRADILAAAEQVFAVKGFHQASIEEIARRAEFASGTVYLYFRDKESLYIELFEQKVQELMAMVSQRISAQDDPLQALEALVEARMGYFERNRAFFSIYAREGMNLYEKRHDRWQGVIRLYEEYLAIIASQVDSGQRRGIFRAGDPHLFAVALSGMMIQLTRDWLRNEGEESLSVRARFLVELFMKGACARVNP